MKVIDITKFTVVKTGQTCVIPEPTDVQCLRKIMQKNEKYVYWLQPANADQDELGESAWTIPRFIAETLELPHVIGATFASPKAAPPRSGAPRAISNVAVVHDLGPLSIEVAGRIIEGTDSRPRSVALLHYLATRPRHAATRDEAIDALWPEAEAQAGLNSLNQMSL